MRGPFKYGFGKCLAGFVFDSDVGAGYVPGVQPKVFFGGELSQHLIISGSIPANPHGVPIDDKFVKRQRTLRLSSFVCCVSVSRLICWRLVARSNS